MKDGMAELIIALSGLIVALITLYVIKFHSKDSWHSRGDKLKAIICIIVLVLFGIGAICLKFYKNYILRI